MRQSSLRCFGYALQRMLNALVRKVDLIQVKVAKKGGEGPKTI